MKGGEGGLFRAAAAAAAHSLGPLANAYRRREMSSNGDGRGAGGGGGQAGGGSAVVGRRVGGGGRASGGSAVAGERRVGGGGQAGRRWFLQPQQVTMIAAHAEEVLHDHGNSRFDKKNGCYLCVITPPKSA